MPWPVGVQRWREVARLGFVLRGGWRIPEQRSPPQERHDLGGGTPSPYPSQPPEPRQKASISVTGGCLELLFINIFQAQPLSWDPSPVCLPATSAVL